MSIIDDIKDRVSMLEVLQMYGQYPVRGRNNYRCFIHQDKHPSAGITRRGTHFHCFSCLYIGSIFDVVMHFEKCDIRQALRILDEKFGLGVITDLTPAEKRALSREIAERKRQEEERQEMERYKAELSASILAGIKLWETIACESCIKKGEYRDKWSEQCADAYFYALKRVRWLDWLYAKLNRLNYKECEYDYMYPVGDFRLLAMIKSGDIVV